MVEGILVFLFYILAACSMDKTLVCRKPVVRFSSQLFLEWSWCELLREEVFLLLSALCSGTVVWASCYWVLLGREDWSCPQSFSNFCLVWNIYSSAARDVTLKGFVCATDKIHRHTLFNPGLLWVGFGKCERSEVCKTLFNSEVPGICVSVPEDHCLTWAQTWRSGVFESR